MQLKFETAIAKPSTAQGWWQRCSPCLWCLSNLSLAIGYIALLFYSLVWGAGDIVNLPTKRIGFYNFCLWDQETEKLHCLKPKELEKMGISLNVLVLSRFFVYTMPVLGLFVGTMVLQALCLKDRAVWKLAGFVLLICDLILPVGLALFLFHLQQWIHFSEFGEVFTMLLGAHILLFIYLPIKYWGGMKS
uniref:Transmembrane protein 140 n=1 Tax=Varanus komodoensis TaxID=61221 RepID=A0A8D2KZA7_VARKO